MRLFLKILIVYLLFALLTSIPAFHIWNETDDPDVDLYRNTAILVWPLFFGLSPLAALSSLPSTVSGCISKIENNGVLSTPLHKGANMKFYVMSDLHGFYTLAIKALTDAGFYDDQNSKKLILLGDCFDRGNEARAMESWLLKLLDDSDAILIKGNHEDLFEDLLLKDFGQPRSHHVSNGTYDTALQLTGFDLGMAQAARTTFVKTAMATPYYKTIIPAMQDYYETEHYIFVHGYIPERRDWYNADAQEWRDARWINGMGAALTDPKEKTVVCGHFHASWGHAKIEHSCPEFGTGSDFTPYYGNKIIGIDACTAYTGFVNCIVLEDEELK